MPEPRVPTNAASHAKRNKIPRVVIIAQCRGFEMRPARCTIPPRRRAPKGVVPTQLELYSTSTTAVDRGSRADPRSEDSVAPPEGQKRKNWSAVTLGNSNYYSFITRS